MCCRPAARSQRVGCSSDRTPKETSGPEMHPKPAGQQNPPNDCNQPMRKHSQRAQTRASMTTEYQERFLPPRCRSAVVSTSTQKDPDRPLKATSADVTTFKSYHVTPKWIRNPPKDPQPPPRHSLAHFAENQQAPAVEDYTSVYQNDFQAWRADKRQPFKLTDSLKVNLGVVVPSRGSAKSKAARQSREPRPFESITSYRSDYVSHPVQPGTCREKPAPQTNRGPSLEAAPAPRPNVTWDTNRESFVEAGEFPLKSLENRTHGKVDAKESGLFLSTTHADYTAHRCQRTRPVLPLMQTSEKSMKRFQAKTTMKEDYKAWDTPRHLPTVHKDLDRSKKTNFSAFEPAEGCKTKPFGRHPKVNDSGVHFSCHAAENPRRPAENEALPGFECTSTRDEESRTTSDPRLTFPNGDVCTAQC